MAGSSETTPVNESNLSSTDEVNIPKLLTLKIHFYLIKLSRYWRQTDCEVIFPVEDYPCNNLGYRSCRAKLSIVDLKYNLYRTHIA